MKKIVTSLWLLFMVIFQGCNQDSTKSESTYSVSGTTMGLVGNGLVLQKNGNDNLSVTSNGAFTFATSLNDGSNYNITVLQQPSSPNQICDVSNGIGVIAGNDVTNVTINCVSTQYSVGGMVNGLLGKGLVLQNNGNNNLDISNDGSFNFTSYLEDGAAYNVTVLSQPNDPLQSCSVSNGSGSLSGTDITNISVNCIDTTNPSVTAVHPVSSSLLAAKTPITILFSEPMDTNTLTLGDTLSSLVNTATWSPNGFIPNAALTLTPFSNWDNGSQTLIVNVNDLSGNPLTQLNLSYNVDNVLPTASVSPIAGSSITISQIITVGFSEAIDESSIVIGGSLGSLSNGGTLSADKLTLTLLPSSSWTVGSQDLTIDAKDIAGNAIETLLLTFTVDNTAPIVSSLPTDLSPIASSDHIVLTFSEPMDETSVKVEVSDASGVSLITSGSWNAQKDSYEFWKSLWPETTLNIKVTGNDLAGNAMTGYAYKLGVIDTTIFVDVNNGSDINPGTKDLPMKEINTASAVRAADFTSVSKVLAAAGTYTYGIPIIRNGLSFQGGWDSNFATNDPSVNSTIIKSRSRVSGAYKNGVVYIGAGVGEGNLTGFTIYAEGGYAVVDSIEKYVGIYIDGQDQAAVSGTGFVISMNTIMIGTSGWSADAAIYHKGRSAGIVKILDNNITSGYDYLYNGIIVDGVYNSNNYSPSYYIQGNRIILSQTNGGNFHGIYSELGKYTIIGNIIDIENSVNSTAYGMRFKNLNDTASNINNNIVSVSGFNAYAMSLESTISLDLSQTILIKYNTLLATGGSSSGSGYAIYYNTQNGLYLYNNILMGKGGFKSVCLTGSVAEPLAVLNNDFGCNSKYFDGNSSIYYSDIASMESIITNGSGNINIDPIFINFAAKDFHMSSTSPCSVTQGANTSYTTSTDLEGTARPGSDTFYSIGAYEQDGACSSTSSTWVP